MSGLKARSINITRDEKEDVASTIKTDRIIFRIFLTALVLIPLIVGAKATLFISPMVSGVEVTSTNYQLDFFTFFKFALLLLITIITLLLFLYKVFFLNYKIKWSFPLYAIALFVVALTLSVVFAEYKTIAMWGIYNRHDGALTFIAYAVLMFIALNITYPKKALNCLVYVLYPFVWVNVIISLLNLYGINILENSLIRELFTLFLIDEMSIGEDSILTGTLNQWNYMSGYSAVMAILFLTLAVFHGSMKSKIANLLTSIAAFSTILASISTSGFVSLLLMIVILVALTFIKKNMKKSLVWLASFIILVSISTTVLAKHNPQVWTESFGFFTKTNPFVQVEATFKEFGSIDNKVSAADPTLELPALPERTLSGGSGRVYIWENMIPLIKEKPITGYGLDTLTYHFPQNDINKRDGFMYETVLIDKPHNLFIGLLYGTGLLGLLSFLCIVALYTFKLGKYILKDQQSPIIWSFTFGWGAFLIQALLNDSVIGATFVPLLATAIIYTITNTQDGIEIS